MRQLLVFLLVAAFSAAGYAQDGKPKTIALLPDTGIGSEKLFEKINGENSSQQNTPHSIYAKTAIPFSLTRYADDPKVISKNNRPVYIEKKNSLYKTAKALPPAERFFGFMENTAGITGITRPREAYHIGSIHTDSLGITHVRASRRYKGVEVYGSDVIYHAGRVNERFNGAISPFELDIDVIPSVSAETAVEMARKDLQRLMPVRELTPAEKELLHYKTPGCSLIIFNRGKDDFGLTWLVTIRPNHLQEWKYFIDAHDGNILRKFNSAPSDGPAVGTGTDLNGRQRNFSVYQSGDIYYLYNVTESMYNPAKNLGIIVTLDANYTSSVFLDFSHITSPDNSWTQQNAISAHCNATETYRYFDATFNRKSIDGEGGDIISLVNVVNDDGSPLENAFWNGQAIFYGNGGSRVKPLAGALDVTAHEYTHGVISASTNLEYFGQSGALQEALADFFACMVDRSDWQIGEDIALPEAYPSGAVRDLSDPHNQGNPGDPWWQPSHMKEYYWGEDDNKGVHINSGIISYALYLFANATGKDFAELVVYRALTEYLTRTSDFIDFRIAVIESAKDLYGEQSPFIELAAASFDAAGIYHEAVSSGIPYLETNPGEEFLLSYDTSPVDPATLYLSSAVGTNYRRLTMTPMKGKVSLTDDGSTGVFVSTDHRLRMINASLMPANERIISGNLLFSNASISKDGRLIAATSVFADASVYVFDLESGEGRQFALYNPTTSHANTSSGGVIKADALEFDITGEYLIYDAYNVLNSNSIKDLYYWDIGFIKVWDHTKDDFGNGTITKLFDALPEHVSITNPVFSRNAPHIVAFDYYYYDGIIEEYGIYGADILTGELNKIVANDRLGYPSFSKNDDRIAYSAANGEQMQVIKSIRLKNNTIPMGEPGVLVPEAKWPVYFANGTRTLGFKPVVNFTADLKEGTSPLSVKFIDLTEYDPTTWEWSFEGGIPASSTEQNPLVQYSDPGIYQVKLTVTNRFGSDSLVKNNYISVAGITVNKNQHDQRFSIYPNPVTDVLHITCNEPFTVTIYNQQGITLLNSSENSITGVSGLTPGIYLLELRTGSAAYRSKFVKH
ncbi:MAG: M4 family metallopeptidase [Bacteroidales bacterium]|nr:M4 family metallopeptidase [Bacteroidales bacterium]